MKKLIFVRNVNEGGLCAVLLVEGDQIVKAKADMSGHDDLKVEHSTIELTERDMIFAEEIFNSIRLKQVKPWRLKTFGIL